MSGMFDIDVFHEGEADLYEHHKSCQKNPDHKDFIPVDKFDITHLPPNYQDRDIVEYIKLVAQLTVRVTVKYVSPDRPATLIGTDIPYPFYEHRGKPNSRVGTGLIIGVTRSLIIISTATHVVFDKEEAKHTSIDLFYDIGNKPADSKDATELKCQFLEERDNNSIMDQNVLIMKGSIHESLTQKLHLILSKLLEFRHTIRQRLLQNAYGRDNKPLTLIVSHPHGCSKKISIGRCVELDDNLDNVNFVYTTATCPGSSGAAVICLDKFALNLNSVHSGKWRKVASLNHGLCRYAHLDSHHISYNLTLHGWIANLRKHDWYLKRFLYDTKFKSSLVLDLINTFSHLIVPVICDNVSEQRPQFWPGSRRPYPFYKRRGKTNTRKGYGWVDRVTFYPNQSSPEKTCDCNTCRTSSTPERKFAHVYILTSTSLIFDKTENDSQHSLFSYNFINSRRDIQFVNGNVETDRAELMLVTHDLTGLFHIEQKLEIVSHLTHKIRDQYCGPSENPIAISIFENGVGRLDRCVETRKHVLFPIESQQRSVGAPVIVIGNTHFNYEVSGYSGRYKKNVGYSRYLDYQFMKQNERKENAKKRKLTDNMAASSLKHTQVMEPGLEQSEEPACKSARDDLMTPEEPQGDEIGKERSTHD